MLMNRRLYRSRTDTILGGVAAGLATYLNTDPALVRIAWAILVPLTSGAAFIAYIVAWIVVPEEPQATSAMPAAATVDASGEPVDPDTPVVPASGRTWTAPEPARASGNAGVFVGAALVLLGLWFLLREYLPDFDWGLVWPLVIVGIGALILVTATRRRDSA
jgi:phage shock protein C